MFLVLLEDVKNIITILGIFAAGTWTIYRFGITREKYPKLQFDLDLEILGKTNEHYIVQLIAIVENKGITRQYIHDFKFNLLCFDNNSPIDCEVDKINGQVKFKILLSSKNWVMQKSSTSFVDGNIKHRFTFNTIVPVSAAYIMIYSKFRDPKSGLFKKSFDQYHTSKTFNVKKLYQE